MSEKTFSRPPSVAQVAAREQRQQREVEGREYVDSHKVKIGKYADLAKKLGLPVLFDWERGSSHFLAKDFGKDHFHQSIEELRKVWGDETECEIDVEKKNKSGGDTNDKVYTVQVFVHYFYKDENVGEDEAGFLSSEVVVDKNVYDEMIKELTGK